MSVSDGSVLEVIARLKDPNRAALFEKSLENPGAPGPRRGLAKRYFSAGFPVAAKFYEATVGFITSKGNVIVPRVTAQQWLRCGSFEEEKAGGRVAEKVYDLLLKSWPLSDRPLKEMHHLLESKPATCNLLAAWSLVTLSYAGFRNRLVTEEEEELAFALRVELGEDALEIFVDPLDSPTAAYYDVADFFYMRGDMVSAYVAARFAKQRMECWGSGNVTPDSQLELLAPMLGSRTAALKQIGEASSQNGKD